MRVLTLCVENCDMSNVASANNCKYKLENPEFKKKFLNTLQNRDRYGNNACHYLFEIENPDIRNECLKLFIKNKVGDFTQRNNLGYLPFDLLHDLQLE